MALVEGQSKTEGRPPPKAVGGRSGARRAPLGAFGRGAPGRGVNGTSRGAIGTWRPSSAEGGAGEIGVQAGAASGIWPRVTGARAPSGRGEPAGTAAPSVTAGED